MSAASEPPGFDQHHHPVDQPVSYFSSKKRTDLSMQLVLQPSPAAVRRNSNFVLALVFLVFTYALFTYRANLRYGDAYELLSVGRLVSTVVGAALYWLVLVKLIDGSRNRPGKPLAVVATVLPASIVVLLARVTLDQLGVNNPNGFPGDLRFVMVWGGYFGLWVSASFVLRVPAPKLDAGGPAAPTVKPKTGKTATARQNANATARAEVLERLALEIASLPAAQRRALMESFAVRTRYDVADEFEK